MVQFSLFHDRTPLIVALIATVCSFLLFQLALIQDANTNIFAALHSTSVWVEPSQFNGIAGVIIAKLLRFTGDPAFIMRLLTALLSGATAFILGKLFKEDQRSIGFILLSVGFLFFASHSSASMLTLLWVASILLAMQRDKLQMAALLAGLGFGVDQLLALVFGLYVIGLTATQHKSPIALLRKLGLLLLGIGVWTLLAWMLFGSSGIGQALTSGFDNLLTRVNPLNFGVAVIIQFNVLLIRFFRVKTERSRWPYLGSWLITVFLFIRSEEIYVLILLLGGVCYLTEMDKSLSRSKMLPAFAVIALGFFFLMPNIEPLASRYQPREEQASDAATYLNSINIPSFAALCEKETKLLAGRTLIAQTDAASAIVLDPITREWFEQTAIGAGYPDRFIGRYEADVRRFRGGGRDTSLVSPVRSASARYFIGTTSTPQGAQQNLQKIKEIDGLTLYIVDSSKLNEFFDSYIYHYFTSFH